MSRLLYIAPIQVEGEIFEQGIEGQARDGNILDTVAFARGPKHLEYHYYEALATPDIIHSVLEAEQQGYDAAIIGCFYDLGLHESREVAERIVVTAPCESSILLAASLGSTFSIIVGRRKWIPQMRANVHEYGLGSRLASFRTLDLGVLDYHADEQETERRFIDAGRKAIEEDRAEIIVLGCTASAGFYQQMQNELGVPVIDSAIAAVKHAEQLVEVRDRFGWYTSKVGGYESPPRSEIEAWELEEEFGAREVERVWQGHTARLQVR
jgi:Asp/Glu/hydantoin racemase